MRRWKIGKDIGTGYAQEQLLDVIKTDVDK